MLFLFLVCHDDSFDPPVTIGPETEAWVASVANGRRAGGRAAPPGEATVVRVRDGERRETPGPRSGEAEPIAGFDLLEFPTEAEAVEAAARHPMATHGTIEVRPMWDGE